MGHLFCDVKDFTRRTAFLKEAVVADFLSREFYTPILTAAACRRRMSSPSISLPSLNRNRENRRNTSGRPRLFPKDLPETGKFMFARRRGADNVQPEEHRGGASEMREVRLR